MSVSGLSEVSDYTRPSFDDVPYIRPTGHRIREYPVNILQKVFTYWHSLYAKNLLNAVKSGHAYEEVGMGAPFLLASTCEEFRVAMQDSPNVWSLVYVNFASANKQLVRRLHELLHRSRDEPLTIIFQDVNVRACRTLWYQEMRKILEPTKPRWVTVAVSFTRPQDLQDCWNLWPLLGNKVSDLRIWGSVEGGTSRIPTGFLQGGTALEYLELRNVAWVHHPGRRPMPNVSRLCVGPSVDEVLGHSTVKELCASFPAISSLTLLAFETSLWTSHAEPLPATFQLTNLTHLTVSPVMLGTSLQGFQVRRVIPALMTVSVRFRSTPADEELEEGEEAEERSRRDQDLAAVGMFLKGHEIRTLKLRGLDIGYEPSAVRTHLFENMITKQLANLYLEECSGHTTQYMEMVLKRLTFREMSPVGRGARSVSRASIGGEGLVFLLPGLEYLYAFKCDDLDVTELPNWVRDAPKGLKDVVIRGSKVDIDDEDKYTEAKRNIKHRRR
jgi:hypothetical protein